MALNMFYMVNISFLFPFLSAHFFCQAIAFMYHAAPLPPPFPAFLSRKNHFSAERLQDVTKFPRPGCYDSKRKEKRR